MVDIPLGRINLGKTYLDGNMIYDGPSDSGSYSIKLNQSASGLHVLNVTALSYTYYRGPAYNGSHILTDIMSSSGPVYEYPIKVPLT